MVNSKSFLQPSWRFLLYHFSPVNLPPSSTRHPSKRHFSLVLEAPSSSLTNTNHVPTYIARPHYAKYEEEEEEETSSKLGILASLLGKGSMPRANSLIKNCDQIEKLRYACRVGRRVLNRIRPAVKASVTTDDLDWLAHHLICEENAYPSPLRYQSFPKSICTSVNNVVVHGIPDSRQLEEGDIINVDISVFVNGFHGDLSETFFIGDVDENAQRLVKVTKECLDQAISICGPGQELKKIGEIISSIAHAQGFTVCPHYVGHGIGEEFHEMPQILHHYNDYPGLMVPGMVFTIEPVLCEGETAIDHWKDGWTVVTRDKKRAAQFEHTILITDSGCEVLTKDEPEDDFLQLDATSIERIDELLTSRVRL